MLIYSIARLRNHRAGPIQQYQQNYADRDTISRNITSLISDIINIGKVAKMSAVRLNGVLNKLQDDTRVVIY